MIHTKTWRLEDYRSYGNSAIDQMRGAVESYINTYLEPEQIVTITGAPCIEYKPVQSGYEVIYKNVYTGDFTVWYRS